MYKVDIGSGSTLHLYDYSEPYQISRLHLFVKKLTAISRSILMQKDPSWMFDRVLNMPMRHIPLENLKV